MKKISDVKRLNRRVYKFSFINVQNTDSCRVQERRGANNGLEQTVGSLTVGFQPFQRYWSETSCLLAVASGSGRRTSKQQRLVLPALMCMNRAPSRLLEVSTLKVETSLLNWRAKQRCREVSCSSLANQGFLGHAVGKGSAGKWSSHRSRFSLK